MFKVGVACGNMGIELGIREKERKIIVISFAVPACVRELMCGDMDDGNDAEASFIARQPRRSMTFRGPTDNEVTTG